MIAIAALLGLAVVRRRPDARRGRVALDSGAGPAHRAAQPQGAHAHFAEVAKQAEMTGRSVCMVLMDLDHFKAVNDEHGHSRGDAVLRDAAEVMRNNLRSFELVYRVGGEEFLVLMPGVDRAGWPHRRRPSAHRSRAGAAAASCEVTASFGVAMATGRAVDFEHALRRRRQGALPRQGRGPQPRGARSRARRELAGRGSRRGQPPTPRHAAATIVRPPDTRRIRPSHPGQERSHDLTYTPGVVAQGVPAPRGRRRGGQRRVFSPPAARDSETSSSTTDGSLAEASPRAPGRRSCQGDLEILNYALTLEYLEADFYTQVIDSGLVKDKKRRRPRQGDRPARAGARRRPDRDRSRQLGGTPVEPPRRSSRPVLEQGLRDGPRDRRDGREPRRRRVPRPGAGASRTRTILAAALSIHSVEARHAAGAQPARRPRLHRRRARSRARSPTARSPKRMDMDARARSRQALPRELIGDDDMRDQHLAAPSSQPIEVRGMTRSAFLVRSALAAGAVYGVGRRDPRSCPARIAQGGDVEILNFALTLEYLEAAFYDAGPQGGHGPVRGDQGARHGDPRQRGRARRRARPAIKDAGGKPVKAPGVDFGDAFAARRRSSSSPRRSRTPASAPTTAPARRSSRARSSARPARSSRSRRATPP